MIALLLASALAASTPGRVQLVPARARPGDAFLVHVSHTASAPAGTAAGRPLSFFRVRGGFAAVGALPVETAPGALPVRIAAGAAHELETTLEVDPSAFPQRELNVDQRFVEQPDPGVRARVEEDHAAFAKAFAQPASAPLFSSSFVWPRRSRVTAGFGEQRTLNGVKPSQHYGLDLAGKVGAPVVAANAGKVVLVRDCWASGKSIIVWHGAGLYTAYFHLSRTLVRPGARVTRGQRIGLVGQTGRVSGPHLHWSVRVGDLYVDPRSVLRLPLGSMR